MISGSEDDLLHTEVGHDNNVSDWVKDITNACHTFVQVWTKMYLLFILLC